MRCASGYGTEAARQTAMKLALRAPAGHSPQNVPFQRLHAFGDRSMTFEVNVTFFSTRARPECAAR